MRQRKWIFHLIIIALVLLSIPISAAALTVDGVPIVSGFQPGYGTPVGHVQSVKGEAVIIHKQGREGYFAEPGLDLYQGDNLITRKDGHLRLALNDESIMVLAPETTLTIDQSVYDPDRESRSSFTDMAKGKAWFLIKKLGTFRRSEFKVKTQTAIAGVRGSEFIIVADKERSQITAVKDTRLEVAFLAAPEVPPITLTDLQQTTVLKGAKTAVVVPVTMEQIREIMSEFLISPHEKVSEVREKATEGKARQSILVSPSDLVPPEYLAQVPELLRGRLIDPAAYDSPSQMIKRLRDHDILEQIKEEIKEELREGHVRQDALPDFPQLPE